MEGSGETECSKTSPSSEKNDEEDEMKDGGSSSNCTVEDNEKKSSVRPYVRSKMPRLRWNTDLHLRFVNAVERLGGHDRATPKLVLQMMNIKGLNIAHVKSHLQMYRSKRIDDTNQGMMDHRLFVEGVDRNIYNLSQLPLLPSLNQEHVNSKFRYGDASWNAQGKWMQNSNVMHHTSNMTRPGFGCTLSERILTSQYNYRSSSNFDIHPRNPTCTIEGSIWRTQKDPRHEYESLHKEETVLGQSRLSLIELNPSKQRTSLDIDHTHGSEATSLAHTLRQNIGNKRKAGVDLDLSLGLETRNVEDALSLSLNTVSSSSSKMNKKMKEDFLSRNARGASTLDLTL